MPESSSSRPARSDALQRGPGQAAAQADPLDAEREERGRVDDVLVSPATMLSGAGIAAASRRMVSSSSTPGTKTQSAPAST